MNNFLYKLILWLAGFIDDTKIVKELQKEIGHAYDVANNRGYMSLQCPNCKQFTSRSNPVKFYQNLVPSPYDAMVCGNCEHLSFWIDHGIIKDLPESEKNPTVVILNSDIPHDVHMMLPDTMRKYLRKRMI